MSQYHKLCLFLSLQNFLAGKPLSTPFQTLSNRPNRCPTHHPFDMIAFSVFWGFHPHCTVNILPTTAPAIAQAVSIDSARQSRSFDTPYASIASVHLPLSCFSSFFVFPSVFSPYLANRVVDFRDYFAAVQPWIIPFH